MGKEDNSTAFSYFSTSERIEELTEQLDGESILNLIIKAQKGDQDAMLYLVNECLNSVRSAFLVNKEFSGNDHNYLSLFLKKLLWLNGKEEGPFFTVDILDASNDEQLEQLSIEFYAFGKTLGANEDIGNPFPEEQETDPLLEEKGLFRYLNNIRPEYSQLLLYMVHYTPSDEICQEMEISGLSSLKSKIRALKTLVDHYYQKEDRRDDEYKLAK
jgi:hypothetical protein